MEETITKIENIKRKNPNLELKDLKKYSNDQKLATGEKEIKLIIIFNEVLLYARIVPIFILTFVDSVLDYI